MKTTTRKIFGVLAMGMAFAGMTMLSSCNPEPDESDMFTATGETAADYIQRKPNLSSFSAILTRAGLIRTLSAYGEFTCFVPTNEAIALYIDSLWRDTVAVDAKGERDHNGLTANSLEGLLDTNNPKSDSICKDFARFHLTDGVHNTIEMAQNATFRTMQGRSVSTDNKGKNGRVRIEAGSEIIEGDSIVTNGIVHVLDRIIPRSSRALKDEFDRYRTDYSIFIDALKLTGLADSLRATRKDKTYELADYSDTNGTLLYYPTECLLGFTIFAEPDEILKQELAKGGYSQDLEGLKAYANDLYKNARDWYDYLEEHDITVSTGTDYTNRFNALNMFVAYHILKAGMPENQLVYEKNASNTTTWNYVNGGEPYDYYETMLPHTLMKIWQPTQTANTGNRLFINRYRAYNTLTDILPHYTTVDETTGDVKIENRLGYGSDGMHPVKNEGVEVLRTSRGRPYATNLHALNGYIHAIDKVLVYDRDVPTGVLHERMRFDATTFLPEFINNNIRMMTMSECNKLSPGGNGARVAFPLDYFDNVISYTDGNKIRYNVKGAYNAWQADAFQGWGKYDLAMRMPPLPTGTYEFRLYYAPMDHGGMMQFYMAEVDKYNGEKPTLSKMMALDIPLDVRILKDDPRIGWTDYMEEEDFGVGTDVALHNRGYMRGPFAFKDHPEYTTDGVTGIWSTNFNMRRGTRNTGLRRVLGRMTIKQGMEYWFRYKSVLNDDADLKWQLDFVEFVPTDVVDNDQYSEDWY